MTIPGRRDRLGPCEELSLGRGRGFDFPRKRLGRFFGELTPKAPHRQLVALLLCKALPLVLGNHRVNDVRRCGLRNLLKALRTR